MVVDDEDGAVKSEGTAGAGIAFHTATRLAVGESKPARGSPSVSTGQLVASPPIAPYRLTFASRQIR